MTAVDISKINQKVVPKNIETPCSDRLLYKTTSKLYCHPDDIAYALCKPRHREQWDMNLLEIGDAKIDPKMAQSLEILYQSYTGREMTQAVDYTFYKEDNGVYYILEVTLLDLFKNEHNYRLFELRTCLDQHCEEYLALTVYTDTTINMMHHRGEHIVKTDYLKGLLAYINLADDLPSSRKDLLLRKTSSMNSDGENKNRLSGRLRFSFKNGNNSLEQINESAEDHYSEDEYEEFKMDQLNMKDTLLTIDKSDLADSDLADSELLGEGESDYEISMKDKLYDEVDDILCSELQIDVDIQRMDSDDLTQIKDEAREFDS
jgi:hypothetical protein